MKWIGGAELLAAFEEQIAAEFNAGEIPYPVHLESGNEDQLIEIFRDIKPEDWIMGTWRLHLKALLKGVPPDELRAAIHRGESMALQFPEHRVYGSAIAGGIIPIALGVALAIKRRRGNGRVWCFLGDMMSKSGIFHECAKYAGNHALPITWVIEDNGVSVMTPTEKVWGEYNNVPFYRSVRYYRYQSKYPHCGAGKRVQF
jgi:pyruvate dehydrogenase E1 component alpha subunit